MNANDLKSFPSIGYVRLPLILSVFPISRSSWYSGIQAGKYPKPVKLSERVSAWRASEIKALLEAK